MEATDLFDAVNQSDMHGVETTIARGADVNATDDDGDTPLILASELGYTEIARVLIENGADIDKKDGEGYAPVEIAIQCERFPVAKLLIESYCDISVTGGGLGLMHAAAARVSTGIGRMLRRRGMSLESVDSSGRTPLHWAAQEGKIRFARWLIDSGVQVDTDDNKGFTPLLLATGDGRTRIAELLLSAGADVNHSSRVGTALSSAFAWNRPKTIDLLERYGARFDIKDNNGNYPIWYAIDYKYEGLVRKYASRYKDILSSREKSRLEKRASKRGMADLVDQAF